MQYKSNKGFTGFGQFGMLLLFLGIGIMATGFIQLIIGYSIIPKGTPLTQIETAMLEAMKNPKNLDAVRWMQILGAFFTLFIPAVLYSIVCHGKKALWLGFSKHVSLFQIAIGFLIIFAANYMASPIEDISKKIIAHFPAINLMAKNFENQYNEQVEMLGHIGSLSDLFSALLIMAFLPALFEEMFFRGALQNLLVKWWKQPLIAIIVTSFVFSFIHISYYLFLSRAILGFALGLMFYQTKNIWVNVVAHFLNNAFAVGQMYFINITSEKVDISELDAKLDWWLAIPFAIILYYLFKLLIKKSQENKMKIYAEEQTLANNPEMWQIKIHFKAMSCCHHTINMPLNLNTLKTRTLTAIVFAAVMIAGLLINQYSFIALFLFIMFGCLYEFGKIVKLIDKKKFFLFLPGAIVYIIIPVLMMLDLGFGIRNITISRYYNFLFPCLIIFSIWINDTMAYLVGSFIGKTPFSKISPKKTWEGTIGGALLCIIVIGISFTSLHVDDQINSFHWYAIATISAVFGTIGDLFESKLKRLANIKDSGTIMPGHGGFLDRFDSMLLATPAVWFYVKIFMN